MDSDSANELSEPLWPHLRKKETDVLTEIYCVLGIFHFFISFNAPKQPNEVRDRTIIDSQSRLEQFV